MKRALADVVVTLAVVLVLALLVWQWRSAQASAIELHRMRVAAANAAAAADSSHRRLVLVHGAELAVAERRAFQAEVRAELAEADAHEQAVVAAAFKLEADSLKRQVSRETRADSAGTIAIADTLDARDSLGLTAAVQVELRPDALDPRLYQAAWTWDVRREQARFRLELTCRGAEAIARLAGPVWAPVALDSVVQPAEYCNPLPPVWQPLRIRAPSAAEAGAVILGWEALRWALRQAFGGWGGT